MKAHEGIQTGQFAQRYWIAPALSSDRRRRNRMRNVGTNESIDAVVGVERGSSSILAGAPQIIGAFCVHRWLRRGPSDGGRRSTAF